jgi:hypothetical protein
MGALACVLSSGCIGVSQGGGGGAGGAAKGPTTFKAHASLKVCPGQKTRIAANGLIDDFEDGDTRMSELDGRGGYWWKAKDEKGSDIGPEDSTPVPQGVNGSLAIYMKGQTVSEEGAWGVNFGANFRDSQGDMYDASQYAGITFKARVGPHSTKRVRFRYTDVNTHKDPGVCKDCWNHFGKDLSLTEEWRDYVVLFEEVRQAPGWGDPRPASVTPAQLYGMDWAIDKGQVFEIWVDDVQFLECAE